MQVSKGVSPFQLVGVHDRDCNSSEYKGAAGGGGGGDRLHSTHRMKMKKEFATP